MGHYLLIHGGCHGGWCWDQVRNELETQGHEVTAPDLPGGEKPGGGGYSECLRTLESTIDHISTSALTVVAHSISGFYLPELAHSRTHRIESLIFLAAAVRDRCQRGIDLIPNPRRTFYWHQIGKSRSATLLPTRANAHHRFFNDLPKSTSDFYWQKLRPQTSLPYLVRSTTNPRTLPVPSRYIACTRDKTFAPNQARSFAQKLRAPLEWIDAAHCVMLSQPTTLARRLSSPH